MRHLWLTALAGGVLFGLAQAHADSGPELFHKLGCDKCHSVKAQNIEKRAEEPEPSGLDALVGGGEEEEVEPPDLSGIGTEHDQEWFKKWLRKQVRNEDDRKHKEKFKGSDEELDAITHFVAGLKTKAEGAK